MTISVCMSTYNGERFIEEQLYSVFNQTRRPDEVILCDDASSDRTAEIIEKFLQEHHLENTWKFFRNQKNKGYPANFYYAMSLCSGDFVFLADQDDIWHTEKLERMSEELVKHPQIKALCCKFDLIDADGERIHAVMAPSHAKDTETLQKISVREVFYKCEWLGMVVAYRNEWYRNSLQAQIAGIEDKIPHDLLIYARSAEEDGFWQMDRKLACHRRHDNNVGGEEHRVKKLLSKERKRREIKNYLNFLNAFIEMQIMQTEKGKEIVKQKRQVMQERCDALDSGRIRNVLRWAWKHQKDVRLATAICDLLIVKQHK